MANKIFKTLEEQIDILKDRGLIIKDEESAKSILFKENYFFLNGYRHLLSDKNIKNRFLEGSTFEELYSIFKFDRQIRNIFFKNILIVENNMKSIISYQLSKKYGYKEKEYLNPDNYTQDNLKIRQVNDLLSKIKRQVRVNGRNHSATLHYLDNYGYVPLWIMVKVLSFGIIAEFYTILKPGDQTAIANVYGISPETLSDYLSILSNFRNLCAHEDILYDHRTQRVIPDCEYHEILNISVDEEGEYIYGKNDLFALVIILKKLLSKDEFSEMMFEIKYQIRVLDDMIDTVPLSTILNRLGFPDNWEKICEK